MSHVIAAVSTGNQISAIGILRLTGEGCADVAGAVFTLNNGKPLKDAPNRKLMLGTLRDKEGRTIDQCMAVYTRAPHSYTGEDTVEIQCHGSPAVLAAGLEALYLAGAKPAKRGEFTKRAFLNGQLSLTSLKRTVPTPPPTPPVRWAAFCKRSWPRFIITSPTFAAISMRYWTIPMRISTIFL